MNILLVALEIAPFVASNSAADSVAQLARALRLLDHSVTVVVPRVPAYEEAGLMAARRVSPLEWDSERGPGRALAYDATLPSGVRLTQLEVPDALFSLDRPFDGQAQALAGFGRAVAAYVHAEASSMGHFDVVHAHDAAASLAFLSVRRSLGAAKVMTIHDAERSGSFALPEAAALGLPEELLNSHGFLAGDEQLSLLKGLLGEADAVITPSDAYARKLQAPERQGGLARAFQSVKLCGIAEGIDQATYNPAVDPGLARRFDAVRPEDKGRNRSEMLRQLELEFDLERPVLVCERGDETDTGWATLLSAVPALMRNQVTLVLLGGDEKAQQAVEPFTGQAKCLAQVDDATRRRLLAGADFYLSVARKDPSGRRLMQAMRYGAVPIAFATDAVTDVVVDADAQLHTGTGIVYEAMTQRALQTAIARAVAAYAQPQFAQLLRRTMRQDSAWDRAARRHVLVYRQVLSGN